jgi:fermentation-respiration switch protein FrsA (DUF1100 family)
MSSLALTLLLIAGILIVLALGGLLFFTWRQAWTMIHPPRKPFTTTPAAQGLAYEDVSFTTEDGVTLSAWFIPAKNGCTLIACHGIYDNREQFLGPAVALAASGYGFLLYDSRAHGKSGGRFCTYGYDEIHDVAAAVAYLESRPDVDAAQLGILGNSLGGITAIRAAARLPQLRVIMAESTFADFGRDIRAAFSRFTRLPAFPFAPLTIFWGTRMSRIDLNNIRPVQEISRIAPRPLLLISDLADRIVDEPYDGELLYANAREPKTLWQVSECQHVQCFATQKEDYVLRVSAFLEQGFAQAREQSAVGQTLVSEIAGAE